MIDTRKSAGVLHDRPMIPVLDMAVIYALAADLRSSREALNFLDKFDALLSIRLQNIHDALMTQDLEQMTVALLGLHTSAAMVGAAQLHHCTGHIVEGLSRWPFSVPTSRTIMKDLAKEAIQFTRAYRVLRSQPILNHGPTPPSVHQPEQPIPHD